MKKMFTMMAAIMITAIAIAQNFNSVLNFRLQNNAPFALYINGIMASNFSNRATIENLRPGRHQISVAVMPNNPRGHGNRNMQTVFSGWITIAPNNVVYASLNRFNQINIEHSYAIHQNRRWRHQLYQQPNRWNDYTDYNQPIVTEPYMPIQLEIIDAVSFQQLKETMRNTSFESTRQSVLNQASNGYWFTTHQVKELISLFSFESTKLDVAKRMYDRTVDKQNYFTVNQVFSFNSSVEDLTQYLAQR